MSKQLYDEVIEALSMNREIEFSYNEKSYAFVYHQEGWCLVNRERNLSDYYEDNKKLLELKIEDKCIKELLTNDKITIETIF